MADAHEELRVAGDKIKRYGDQGGDVRKKPRTQLFEAFPDSLRRRLKTIIRHFLDSGFAGPKLEPSLPSLAALKIHSCNAFGHSVPFNKATCHVERQTGIFPLFVVFKSGFEILKQYLITGSAPAEQIHRHVLAKLLEFIMDSERESPLQELEKCEDEVSLTVLLVNHVFARLSSSSKFIMDKRYSRKCDRCPCRRDGCDLTGGCGDTNIGNTRVWHGSLNIIVNGDVPLKSTNTCDGEKTDEATGIDRFNVKMKNKAVGLRLNQQIIAEVIVFSFLNKKLQPYSSSFLLPYIGVCGSDLVVYLYDAQHDVLLESCQFQLRNTTTGAINLVTLIIMWLVVNHRYTCSGLTRYMMRMKSNFFTLAKDKLRVYEEELRFGCVDQSDNGRVEEVSDLPWNVEGLKDIDKELEEFGKYF